MSEYNLTRGERTRNEIILSAHSLFINQGYHGTSMRQIASAAGIALGSLYNHFSSKEEVFHAVFLEYHPYKKVIPAIAAAKGDSVEQFVNNALDQMIAIMQERPDFMNLLFIELVEFKSQHAHQLLSIIMPQVTPIILDVLQNYRDKLRPIPPLILMRTFLGLFFAYYLTEIVFAPQAPPEYRENAKEYFINIFLEGILKNLEEDSDIRVNTTEDFNKEKSIEGGSQFSSD